MEMPNRIAIKLGKDEDGKLRFENTQAELDAIAQKLLGDEYNLTNPEAQRAMEEAIETDAIGESAIGTSLRVKEGHPTLSSDRSYTILGHLLDGDGSLMVDATPEGATSFTE